ncbi:hypothetical protein ASF61_14385 [Duganella sp. Leaf126]|nr:hypothetical protein ASF61_14385 [Duganella sp. Leaf126]
MITAIPFIQTHLPGFFPAGAAQAATAALQHSAGLDFVTVGGVCCAQPGDSAGRGMRQHGSPDMLLSQACAPLFVQVTAALAAGHAVKAVLPGPMSFLWLGREDTTADRLPLLARLLPAYCAVLDRLKQLGVQWVQVDEPILGLGLQLPGAWRSAFEYAYWQLNQVGVPLLLATYGAPLQENLGLACRLPVAGLHVDGVCAPHELTSIADWLPVHKVLSVGIVDGRAHGPTDRDTALALLAPLADKRGGKLWLSTSCPLLQGSVPQGSLLEGSLLEGSLLQESLLQRQLLRGSLLQETMPQGSLPQETMAQGSLPHPSLPDELLQQASLCQAPAIPELLRPVAGSQPASHDGAALAFATAKLGELRILKAALAAMAAGKDAARGAGGSPAFFHAFSRASLPMGGFPQ